MGSSRSGKCRRCTRPLACARSRRCGFEGGDEGIGTAARAGLVCHAGRVADEVADEGHAVVGQVVTTTAPVSPAGPACRPQALEMERVHVHVQALMRLALAGNEADLRRNVAVGDLAAEDLLNEVALEIVQDHGRGDDAFGADR